MDLTASYERVVPARVRDRYELREVRNAAAVLAATSPEEFADLVGVLDWFSIEEADIVDPGRNKSDLAARIDERFRRLGWREGRHDVTIESRLRLMPWAPAGEAVPLERSTQVVSEGYKMDNVKGRVAIDVEWNAKDGNLDRDVSAYRALYEGGIIDAGVIITRTQDDLRAWAVELDDSTTKFGTTTTTNLEKLQPRLTRGDGGGCPILAVAICRRTIRSGSDAPAFDDLVPAGPWQPDLPYPDPAGPPGAPAGTQSGSP